MGKNKVYVVAPGRTINTVKGIAHAGAHLTPDLLSGDEKARKAAFSDLVKRGKLNVEDVDEPKADEDVDVEDDTSAGHTVRTIAEALKGIATVEDLDAFVAPGEKRKGILKAVEAAKALLVEASKAEDEPKADEPKADEPKADEPKADEQKLPTPGSQGGAQRKG